MAKHKQYLRPSAARWKDPRGSIDPTDKDLEGKHHLEGKPLEELGGKSVRALIAESEAITVADVRGDADLVPLTPRVVLKPHITSLLSNSFAIAGMELERLAKKAASPEGLNMAELKKYRDLTESVVRLAREEREQEKIDSPEMLTDEELEAIIQEAADKKAGGSGNGL